MKLHNFIKHAGALCVAAVLLFSSCTGNFEKYNKHPYDPTPDDFTKSAQFGAYVTQMLYQMHTSHENQNQMIEQMVGNQYGGYMSTVNIWQGTNFSTYNPSLAWIEYPMNNIFTNFYSVYLQSMEITEGKGYLHAWADILRVAVMLRVVDTYGPIPYSNISADGYYVPYQSVEDVYRAMIDHLDASIEELTLFWGENSGTTLNIAEFDIAYNGNFGKWIKFANSLKLRMAVRMSGVAPAYAAEVAQSAINDGVFTDNSDNLFLPTTDNPYYKAANDWGDLRVGADIQTHLTGYGDPRLPVYLTETKGLGSPYLGVRLGVNTTSTSKAQYESYSQPNFSSDSPLLVMNAAEVAFLMAELALDINGNLNLSIGTPQEWYERGITLSLEQHGATSAEITSYLQNSSMPANYSGGPSGTNQPARNNVSPMWEPAASDDVKLQKIITQKWIANFTLGFEAWCDFRRTGYPILFRSLSNQSNNEVDDDKMVRRLPYPQSEYTQNTANVNAAVQMIGGQDAMNVDLWWAQ